MKKGLWAGAIGALVMASAAAWAIPTPGTKAPTFKLKGLDGKAVTLSQYRGKSLIFYNVWSTKCLYCRKQMPQIEKLAAKYKGKVVFIGGNVDAQAPELKAYIKKNKVKQIAALDTDKTIALSYGVIQTPTAFLIDKEGIIRGVYVGFKPGDEKLIDMDIDTLLKGNLIPPRQITQAGGGCGI